MTSQPNAPTGQVPPQNIEAEESVLGAMLVADSSLTRVIDEVKLGSEDFYLEKHGTIFACARDLYAGSKPVDELSVAEALVQRGEIEEAGGKHYVSELAAKVPAAGNAKHYAETVQQNSLLRRLLGAGQEIQGSVHDRNGDGPAELIGRAEQALADLRAKASVNEPSSWQPVDLADVLDGPGEPEPTILARTDGPALLYDGRIHQVSAEPEAGKGWLALCATADLVEAGCTVVYADFESVPSEIVQRLLALGVSAERIVNQLVYLRPHEPLTETTRADFDAALGQEPALVVLDGVTEALTIHGLDLADNADIARWLELMPRPAARAGAAVLMIDHVVKDKDARGRYAIGAQHKLAGIDVAYALEVVEPFGRGRDGKVRMKVMKDRPGHVRQLAEGDEIAMVNLRSASDGSVSVSLDPPEPGGVDAEGFRPTFLMEKVYRAVEESPGLTAREIRTVGGKANTLDLALRLLVSEGYIEMRPEGSAHRHYPRNPYVADEDERGSE